MTVALHDRRSLIHGNLLRFLLIFHYWCYVGRFRGLLHFRLFGDVINSTFIHHIAHHHNADQKHEHHRSDCQTTSRKRPIHYRSVTLRETRTQTEIEISRRLHRAETPDYLPQLRLLLVKLATRSTVAQVLGRGHAARLSKHQLLELSTNHFTIVFSHKSFSYK